MTFWFSKKESLKEKKDPRLIDHADILEEIQGLKNHTSHIWTWTQIHTWLIALILASIIGAAIAVLLSILP